MREGRAQAARKGSVGAAPAGEPKRSTSSSASSTAPRATSASSRCATHQAMPGSPLPTSNSVERQPGVGLGAADVAQP